MESNQCKDPMDNNKDCRVGQLTSDVGAVGGGDGFDDDHGDIKYESQHDSLNFRGVQVSKHFLRTG